MTAEGVRNVDVRPYCYSYDLRYLLYLGFIYIFRLVEQYCGLRVVCLIDRSL